MYLKNIKAAHISLDSKVSVLIHFCSPNFIFTHVRLDMLVSPLPMADR